MWQAVLLALLAGVLGANAYPHFTKGITAQRFLTVFGSSPVVNVLAGWSGLALAGLCLWGAHPVRYPGLVLLGLAVGALPMGLFHAAGRTIGTRD
ncbi:hypothetical protein [Amycolatopsis alkalitolerans]|uniref:Uncharacterized protein n=1 Tax=Amycolatopsis alkalitolerans TaxID=2547244 RepID=A0A5C4M5U6_9PSEU|nr:hypothetical protein [Amycolatopsis alkalitolerans]TNC28634.1 hypothetical protein FG385_05090 [Amycolatopsis alkalitolerans]